MTLTDSHTDTDTAASFTIDAAGLHRMLRAVMPHRKTDAWATNTGGSIHLQAEITCGGDDCWPLLTLAAADGYTLAAHCAVARDENARDITVLIDGERCAELLTEMHAPGARAGDATITVTESGVTVELPQPRAALKRTWRRTWHLPAVDAPTLDWRARIAQAFATLAESRTEPEAHPMPLSVRDIDKWRHLGDDPVMLCAGPGQPIIVYCGDAIGLARAGRFGQHEGRADVVGSYRENASWALPQAVRADADVEIGIDTDQDIARQLRLAAVITGHYGLATGCLIQGCPDDNGIITAASRITVSPLGAIVLANSINTSGDYQLPYDWDRAEPGLWAARFLAVPALAQHLVDTGQALWADDPGATVVAWTEAPRLTEQDVIKVLEDAAAALAGETRVIR